MSDAEQQSGIDATHDGGWFQELPMVDRYAVLMVDLDATTTDVDGELVAFVPARQETIVLDPMASLLYRCIDGVSPLGDIINDIAEAYDVDPVVVENDVIQVMLELVGRGLMRVRT